MKLSNLPEPKKLKEEMRKIRNKAVHNQNIDMDAFAIWFGNQLPKYLWGGWKKELKEENYNWQRFLKLLGYKREDILLWFQGNIKWEKLISEIKKSIKGPLGKTIIKKKQ